ncbi:2-C-methyl-D-erythritol 2,4-cyclodiphosphate synthase [Methylacidimicrobium cyclopophantes]|uniref:2-C-methyl-D-erythritol 2,4-cyclodiphosphate synthase n=1 Tax=Methylacidimicrobium cyclopophantes TaxID=1041766 RepID=A0A5E6MDZ9_9BACT|nr:2-C-methyl-D-erythritol 2,4-cyclodiphosphate synthase [Methylacidimicrobium cyclopophantes]VVM07433.1 2-C-methyl-D-erythritol 2,4-cyclodiphosphate synthase [Methylacidimicrobium cyclopophantes]
MGRVGIGYDAHRLVTGRKLVLGGVAIPSEKGLHGHSDGDVLLHAIADALLGAIGERDIGHFFPNSDSRWEGVSSLIFLERIRELLHRKGWAIENIDASLIAEAPKIGPYLEEMRAAVSQALGIESSRIGIKATTNEGMGFPGRGEGMAAMAVASVEKA